MIISNEWMNKQSVLLRETLPNTVVVIWKQLLREDSLIEKLSSSMDIIKVPIIKLSFLCLYKLFRIKTVWGEYMP